MATKVRDCNSFVFMSLEGVYFKVGWGGVGRERGSGGPNQAQDTEIKALRGLDTMPDRC